ncbi:MAG: hypothetical protein AB1529_04635 [Candidatus Micrarchaeota archaeon]
MGFVLNGNSEGGDWKPRQKASPKIVLNADMPTIDSLRTMEIMRLRLFCKEDGSSAMLRLRNASQIENDGGTMLLTVTTTREQFLSGMAKGLEVIFWDDGSKAGVRFHVEMVGKDSWLGGQKPLCEPIQ